MVLRTVLAAAAVAAAALAPLPAAQASCHLCFGAVRCEAECAPVYDALTAVESAAPASRASVDVYDVVCHAVADNTGINMHCHD